MQLQNDERVLFTKEMKRDYTILVPTMLPVHFKLMLNILREYGYRAELLENSGQRVVDSGLRNVHNDTCYPALLVIGQMIDALESGRWDVHKVALLITQTGGGCRASNYIHLLRKALKKSGYGFVPVVSLSANGMEKNPGFSLTPMMLDRIFYAMTWRPAHAAGQPVAVPTRQAGVTDALVDRWANRLTDEMKARPLSYRAVRRNYGAIVADFEPSPQNGGEGAGRRGGEIYVKFSPSATTTSRISSSPRGGSSCRGCSISASTASTTSSTTTSSTGRAASGRRSSSAKVYDMLCKSEGRHRGGRPGGAPSGRGLFSAYGGIGPGLYQPWRQNGRGLAADGRNARADRAGGGQHRLHPAVRLPAQPHRGQGDDAHHQGAQPRFEHRGGRLRPGRHQDQPGEPHQADAGQRRLDRRAARGARGAAAAARGGIRRRARRLLRVFQQFPA
ncbi:MAG: hypothetical protein ACLVL7_05135 [Anaerotruncus massiliensis (ex Togo et al. 2019)]